jgi:hypothetical protein
MIPSIYSMHRHDQLSMRRFVSVRMLVAPIAIGLHH